MRLALSLPLSLSITLLALPAAAAQTCCKNGVAKPWKGYNRGVKWVESLEKAKELAKKTERPILLHQLVGDMNKEGC